jgi:hypothetical protein
MFIIPAAPSTFCAIANVRALSADRGRRRRDQVLLALRRQVRLDERALPVRARQELGLVQGAVGLDQVGERLLVPVAVVAVLDVEVLRRPAAQAHDLRHRRHFLRADLDALEAVRAVVEAVRILGQVAQPLLGGAVTRIAHEAVGLCQRRRADELRVDLERQAGAHAGAALDTGHRLGDVDHRLGRDDVLALRRRPLGQQPRDDALDLLPVDRVHVDDQVLDDRVVGHRLDDDLAEAVAVRRLVGRLADLGVAGQARLPVDPDRARAADGGLARAADADRAVLAGARLQHAVEHRHVVGQVDVVVLPAGGLAGLGVVAVELERVLGHQLVLSSGAPQAATS